MTISALSGRGDRTLRPWKCLLLLGAALCLCAGASTAASAQVYLPPLGGNGGGQFKSPCAAGQSLAGVELRVADDVDAIRPVCASTYGPTKIGNETVAASWNGGAGGVRVERLICPPARPVVLAISIGAEGQKTFIVNNVHLFCGLAATTDQQLEDYPSAIFDGPGYKPSPNYVTGDPGSSNRQYTSQRCPAGQVAAGINGRSGIWLDAVGLVCAAPATGSITPPAKPPVALGRPPVRPGTPPPPKLTICEAAREARARNSPAANGLERQCKATRQSRPVPVSGRDMAPRPLRTQ
jgi:hypothetical protein